MNRHTAFLLLFVSCSLIFSCASAKKKLQKGNYKGAYKKALSKLENNPADRPHQRILTLALDELLQEKELEIQDLELAKVSGLKKAIKRTDGMLKLIEEAIPYTKERFVGHRDMLTEQIGSYERSIGGIYFEEGWFYYDEAKMNKSKLSYKDAFLNFEEALKYDESIEGLGLYMDTCMALAQRIVHVQADPVFDIMESWDIDRAFDDIEDYSDRFTKVYYENNGMKSKADCIIDLEFRDLDFDVSTNSDTEIFTERVITGYNTVTDTSGNSIEEPIYESVEGEVKEIEETKVGEWRVEVRVNGSSKHCQWSSTTIRDNVKSTIERYELYGDERAIPSKYKNQSEDEHRSEDDMSEDMIENIFRRFVSDYF